MNGRKSTRLRRKAEALTVGKPPVSYFRYPIGPQIRLGDCTRREYKRLKKDAAQ